MAVDLDEVRKMCELLMIANQGDHFHALGIKVTDIQRGSVTMEIGYSEEIVGNPETGVIHGGVLTALLDSCCGFSASTVLEELALTPTIDLRIDHLGPAEPHKPIYAVGEVYRLSRYVIFTRAIAHQGDVNRPVAQAVGNFTRMETGTFTEFRDTMLAAYDEIVGGKA